MADYRCAVNIIQRSAGRSAVAAAAYRHAQKFTDERTELCHDYTRKEGVLHSEVMTPDNAPNWMQDRAQLWNAVERVENRVNSQVSREFQLSLPHELDHDTHVQLVRDFCEQQLVGRGMIADIAIHAPSSHGDERNHHAHVMTTMRALTDSGDWQKKKARDWNADDVLLEQRKAWADLQNVALERAGVQARVDHRSLEDQGISREPQKHLGPIAMEIERSGRSSNRGVENRLIDERNRLRQEILDAPDMDTRKRAFEQLKFTNWEQRKETTLAAEHAAQNARNAQQERQTRKELEADLERRHGGAKRLLDDKAGTLESRLEAKGLRKFARDLFGRTKADQKELATVKTERDDIRRDEDQRKTQWQKDIERQLSELKAKQAADKEALQSGIEKARERREKDGWSSQQEKLQSAPQSQKSTAERDQQKPPPPELKNPSRESVLDRQGRPKDEAAHLAQSRKAADRVQDARQNVSQDTKDWAKRMKQDVEAFKKDRPQQPAKEKPTHGRVSFSMNTPSDQHRPKPEPKPQKPTQTKTDHVPSSIARDTFGILDSVFGSTAPKAPKAKKTQMQRAQEEFKAAEKRQQEQEKSMKNTKWQKKFDR